MSRTNVRAITTVIFLTLPAFAAVPLSHQAVTRTIHVSATHRDGRPVVDMLTSDFEVKEGGRMQTITVAPATAPLRVALIVSDGGRGQFQYGAARFCDALLGHAEISIIGVVMDFEILADYTPDAATLQGGLLRLGRRLLGGRSPSGITPRLTETILHVAKGIRREGYRTAIVVMRSGGETVPGFGSDMARAVIRESGAVMHVVSAMSPDDTTMGDTGLGNLTVTVILNDGPRESGGRHVQVLGTSMAPEMDRIAAELRNQYEITYTLPPGTKPSDRVSVSSKRRGVTVRAPSRIVN